MNKKNKQILFATLFIVMCSIAIHDDTVFASTHTLNMTSSGAQSVDILSGVNNTVISTDAINVTTSCRYGYNFTISSSVSDNNLYLDGDSSNNAAGTYFTAADGTSTLDNSTNAWGYYYNSDNQVTPTGSSIFQPVPVLGQADTIKTPLAEASSTDINDSFNLYYGVKASSTITPGTYKMIPDTNNSNNDGVIVYQAIIADTCMQYAVHFDPTSTANNTTITGTGTMANQTIYEGASTPLTSNGFTAPTGYEFAGWNTAQDGTGTSYTDGQSVTDLTIVGSTITLYAQWKQTCFPGYICYIGNGADEGTMGRQSAADGNDVQLFVSNFSRTGYGFAGWSDKEDYATNPNAHFYGPNEDITVPTGTTDGGLKLYAVWIESAGNLQDSTKVAELCGSGADSLQAAAYSDEGDSDESTWSITASLNSVSALTDTRDGQTYAIAKLSDNNCWMIENLRLADTHQENNTTVPTTLTTANTNNPLNDGTNVTLKHNYTDTQTYTNLSPTSSVAYDATTAPEGWCTDGSAACYDQSRLRTDNTTNRATYTISTDMTSQDANLYSYGNYYNWYSATAGNGTYDKSSGNTTGDICPIGWHLPTGMGNGEFAVLSNSLGGYKDNDGIAAQMSSSTSPTHTIMKQRLRRFPNNLVYSGMITGDSIGERSSHGSYWSSTAVLQTNAITMFFNSPTFNPGRAIGNKYHGRVVRCIATSS